MKTPTQWLKSFLIFILSFQITACGTILYPERKGQPAGRLDIGIVLLDGIGLLFFIIPGVIAYAVDFNNGTIYLPNSSRANLDLPDIKAVKFDVKNFTPDSLQEIIHEETGFDLDWRDPRLQAVKLKKAEEIPAFFSRAARAAAPGSRVVLLHGGENGHPSGAGGRR